MSVGDMSRGMQCSNQMAVTYRTDWEPAAASRRYALRVVQRSCGIIYTQFNSGFMENPSFEKLSNFSCAHVNMRWIGPMWPRCTFGDQKGLIWKKVLPFGNPPHYWTKNCGLFQILIFFILYWSKRDCFGYFGVFWTKFEGADLKTKTGNNHNRP